ncbi:hypothetical protein B0O80DRAFT_210437 [Mortierella sp. GBAus27b]|nr:hypothetical protein B0O80DRAFT_210437 [Mortierella sp. GBAus27b]
MSVKDPRLSQILPVIRCSDCGIDVEFRLLGEHVCSSAPPMPALPPIPAAANKPTSGLNAGAYKPGYKPPPPIPINSPQPGSPALNSFNSYNGAPLPNSPNRPGTASPRPALPFLEKYAKKNKSSSSPPVPNNNNNNGSNGSGNNVTGSPLSVSPTTPTAPSYDRQVLANGSSNHYQREQNDYFPKTPMEDRFPGSAQQPPSRSRTPMEDGRYGSNSPVPGRSKTPVNEPSAQYSPALSATRGSQPALPQKSNARSPSVNSAQGLGIQGLDANGRVKSPTGGPVYGGDPRNDYGRDPRDREWEKNNGQYGTSPPNRSGSSGSSASSVLTDRSGYPRERSNTVLSERSERSTRSNRSEREERSRYPDEYDRQRDRDGGRRETNGSTRSGRQDPSSAYKTPSPPISPEDARSVDGMSTPKQSPYRPPTPPDASPNPSRGKCTTRLLFFFFLFLLPLSDKTLGFPVPLGCRREALSF